MKKPTTEQPNATWQFAPTGGGIIYGYNNASTEHFKQDPISKVIRETIQNSLDAHADGLPPVTVDVYECELPAENIGAASLKPHLEQALAQTAATGQANGPADYRKAITLLQNEAIPCLAIVDRNTTGLSGRKWNRLIYEEGIPEKDGPGSPGGSFGIGKNAPYNASALHAVIYCTRYTNGRQGRVEKMTGRTQLVSHPDPEEGAMLQHIGFYAAPDNQPIAGPDIPGPFRLEEAGAGLWIVGFKPERAGWQNAAVRAAADNFFHAVHHRNLIVNIGEIAIRHDTIGGILENYKGSARTAHYHRAICKKPVGSTEPAGCIGALDVQINNENGGPRRVAYVNRRGMLITDSKERRRSNPFYPGRGQGGWPDYAAVVTAQDDATDQQLRRMENPAHDLIAAARLPEAEQETVQEQLNNANAQIRDIIEQAVRGADPADYSNLTELAELFPDLDPSRPGKRELQTHTVTPRPQPHRVTTVDDDADRPDRLDEIVPDEDETNGVKKGGGGGGARSPGEKTNVKDRSAPQPRNHAIREMVIIRASASRLSVALQPGPAATGKISFSLEPSGEVQWRESRLPINAVSPVEPPDARVEHADDIISVTVPRNHKGPIRLTLDAGLDQAYTGYTFSERQDPAPTLKGAERISKIRDLLSAGHNQTEISRQLGLSQTRVSQLVVKHRLKGGQRP